MPFNWAPLIPLIGGMPIGTEDAFKTNPDGIYSFAGIDNDKHYINYKKDIDYHVLDENDLKFIKKINYIVSTPPCAGLSSLNASKNSKACGINAEINRYMFWTLSAGIKCFDADVICIENAPALATKKGKPLADRLYKIAKDCGYSTLLYRTSTHFHGIPQRRDRSFILFFKSDKTPKFHYQKLKCKNYKDYLLESKIDNDLIINENIFDDVWYNYIKDCIHSNIRNVLINSNSKTCYQHCYKSNLLEQVKDYAIKSENEKWIHRVTHAIKKNNDGKNIWDSSVVSFNTISNAIIGKTYKGLIHPVEDRSLTIGELMHLMGLPDDFELIDSLKSINHVCQNVPTCTSKFIASQVLDYLNGNLDFFNSDYVVQNNWKETHKVLEHPSLHLS